MSVTARAVGLDRGDQGYWAGWGSRWRVRIGGRRCRRSRFRRAARAGRRPGHSRCGRRCRHDGRRAVGPGCGRVGRAGSALGRAAGCGRWRRRPGITVWARSSRPRIGAQQGGGFAAGAALATCTALVGDLGVFVVGFAGGFLIDVDVVFVACRGSVRRRPGRGWRGRRGRRGRCRRSARRRRSRLGWRARWWRSRE